MVVGNNGKLTMLHLTADKYLISVRDFRAGLKAVLDGNTPRIVGTRWSVRALVIPCPLPYWENSAKHAEVCRRVRVHFRELMKVLEEDQNE